LTDKLWCTSVELAQHKKASFRAQS